MKASTKIILTLVLVSGALGLCLGLFIGYLHGYSHATIRCVEIRRNLWEK